MQTGKGYWTGTRIQRTCVYRAYINGELAYVGMTNNPAGRLTKHAHQKPWWPEVDDVSLEWFDNRTDAKRAERVAIHDENPAFNIVRPALCRSDRG